MPAPKDQADAKEKLKCHKDAIDDFQSQIEIIDLEIETLKEDSGNTLPYLVDEDVNLKNKKHKLLQSKRYHSNAAKAYSYHLEKAGKNRVNTSKGLPWVQQTRVDIQHLYSSY